MNFVTILVSLLNVGLFSAVVSRFTGANMSMLIFFSLLYIGATPVETVTMMSTYLVFIRMSIATQKQRMSFKKLRFFHGWRLIIPISIIVIGLFFYPFLSLATFLFLFITEIMTGLHEKIPEDRRMTAKELLPYITIGVVLMTLSMIIASYTPHPVFYVLGGAVSLLLCVFFWWIGNDRTRLTDTWDKIILLSFIPAGLYGYDLADWLDDMRRYFVRSRLVYNLPLLFLPVFFLSFLMGNLLFGVFSLSGIIVAFFATLGMRIFGYYQMSGKGKFNPVALAITALAACILLLTAPEPIGISSYLDQFLPATQYEFHGILNLFH